MRLIIVGPEYAGKTTLVEKIVDWRDEVIDEPLQVVEGRVVVPNRPGIGVELDMEGVEKHRWRAGDPH